MGVIKGASVLNVEYSLGYVAAIALRRFFNSRPGNADNICVLRADVCVAHQGAVARCIRRQHNARCLAQLEQKNLTQKGRYAVEDAVLGYTRRAAWVDARRSSANIRGMRVLPGPDILRKIVDREAKVFNGGEARPGSELDLS